MKIIRWIGNIIHIILLIILVIAVTFYFTGTMIIGIALFTILIIPVGIVSVIKNKTTRYYSNDNGDKKNEDI